MKNFILNYILNICFIFKKIIKYNSIDLFNLHYLWIIYKHFFKILDNN